MISIRLAKICSRIVIGKNVQTTAKEVSSDAVPFCHQYWSILQKQGYLKPSRQKIVDSHGEFNSFNFLFIRGRVNYGFEHPFISNNEFKIIRDVVRNADIQFKRLKPTEEAMTVYRCVGEKPSIFEQESKLYNKALNTQKGDIITMPEYAYAAGGTQYSDVYKGVEGRGITYEIEVPKGARVSYSGNIVNGKLDNWGAECVFPRSSQFECLESKISEDGNCYKKIRYILPDEPWRINS